jgi:conjugal transfer pilus assembly protein TraB
MNLREQWENLDPAYKRYIYIGGVVLGLVAVFGVLMPDSSTYTAKKEKTIEHLLTDTDTSKVTLQSLAAKIDSSRSNESKLQRQMDALHADITALKSGGGQSTERSLQKEIAELRTALERADRKAEAASKKIEEYEASGFPMVSGSPYQNGPAISASQQEGSGMPIIPSMNSLSDTSSRKNSQGVSSGSEQTSGTTQQEATLELYASAEEFFRAAPSGPVEASGGGIIGPGVSTVAETGPMRIRSIASGDPSSGSVTKKAMAVQKTRDSEKKTEETEDGIYIPAGSMIEAVVLAGMDAPTSQASKRDPFPALMRFKKEAILPNRFTQDIRECFLIVSGYGSLSSERAYFRGERVSCIDEDGTAFEANFDSFAVGEDGKTGVRGRLVTKAGAVIGRAMLAGFGQGLASAFDVSAVPTINTTGGSDVQFQNVLSSDSLQSGAVNGLSTALDKVAEYYLELADELTPVVEIDAGRVVNFVVTKGLTISRKRDLGEGNKS